MAKKRVHRPEGSRPIRPSESWDSTTRPGTSTPTLRARFEDASRPMLRLMQRLPAFLIPVTLGILLFLGLTLTPAWSGLLLIVIALFLFWLTAISWPAISTGSRILRLAIDVGVLVLGVLKLLGRF